MSVSVLHGRSPARVDPVAPDHPDHVAPEAGTVVLLGPGDVPVGAEVLGILVRLPRVPSSRTSADLEPGPLQLAAQQAASRVGDGAGSGPGLGARMIRRGLLLDERARLLHSHGEPLDLTRLEFDLLLYFAHHPGRVLTRDNLLHGVWDRDPAWASARTVDVHVLRLRRALGPEHSTSLQTVRGVGYRWVP